MAKKPNIPDTSTISELLVKEWAAHFPQETISSLLAKAQSIAYTITSTQEELTKLALAKNRLGDLTSLLPPIITSLDDAMKKRQNFISEYGDLGATLDIPYETMDATLRSYENVLSSYATKVQEKYFANLKEIETTLAYLNSLKNLYNDLASITFTIQTDFLKTPEERRKPILRNLYRQFKAVADNTLFMGIAPTVENPLIPDKIDPDEFKSLCAVRKEAKRFADILKASR